MEISELAFRLLILFLPGVLANYLVKRLTVHPKVDLFHFILQSFLFGIAAYFLYWLVVGGLHRLCPNNFDGKVVFFYALQQQASSIEFREIAWTCLSAVVCALGFSFCENRKLLNRAAKAIGVTNKFGELDVWGYAMNLDEVVWVTVRDMENDLAYQGWIQSFSDDGSNAEMLLRDVSVYTNSTAEALYQTGLLYVARDRYKILIECDTIKVSEDVIWKEEDNEPEQRESKQSAQESDIRGIREEGISQQTSDIPAASTSEAAEQAGKKIAQQDAPSNGGKRSSLNSGFPPRRG